MRGCLPQWILKFFHLLAFARNFFFFGLSGVAGGCFKAFVQSRKVSFLTQFRAGHSAIKWIAFSSASRQSRQSVSQSGGFQCRKWCLKGPCSVMSCMTLARSGELSSIRSRCGVPGGSMDGSFEAHRGGEVGEFVDCL